MSSPPAVARPAAWSNALSSRWRRVATSPPLARSDGHRRRQGGQLRGQHRRPGLRGVPADAGRGQWVQENQGGALEVAQLAGAVQSGAGDLK